MLMIRLNGANVMSTAEVHGRPGLRHALVAVAAITVTLVASACGASSKDTATGPSATSSAGSWTSVVSGACKEGTVTLYANTPAGVLTDLANGFEKAYPCIKLNYSRILSPQLVPKIEAEQSSGNGGADVAITEVAGFWQDFSKRGLLAKFTGPNALAWPANYVKGDDYATISIEPFVMVYNKNLVKTAPAGYSALLNPIYKGKTGTTSVLGAGSIVTWYQYLTKYYGSNFLAEWAANKPQQFQGTAGVTQAVASGEVAIGAFSLGSAAQPLIATGAPIGVVVPEHPSANANLIGIMGYSKHPDAAQVLVNYLMSKSAQELWVKESAGFTVSPINVPGSENASTMVITSSSTPTSEQINNFTEMFNREFSS